MTTLSHESKIIPVLSTGLIGVMRGALVRIFVFLVVGAAVLSIIENTGLRASGGGLTYWKLLMLGLGAILAELMGVHRAVVAWHGAHKGQTVAWSMVWMLGFIFSVYNAIGSSAEGQVKRANLQKAALVTYQDVRTDVTNARGRVVADEKSLADLKAMTWQELPKVAGRPVMSAEAATALIASYEGNARLWGLTKGCTDAQGPQARKFCKEHGEAKAAKADLEERSRWQQKIEMAERQLTESREALKAALDKNDRTAVQTSDVTPFVGLASYVTGADPEKIQWIETFQTSFTNMMLVSLAGLVMALMSIQGRVRTPWFDFKGVAMKLRRVLFGGASPEVPARKAEATPAPAVQAQPAALIPVADALRPQPTAQTFRIEDGRVIGEFLRDLNAALVAPAGKAHA